MYVHGGGCLLSGYYDEWPTSANERRAFVRGWAAEVRETRRYRDLKPASTLEFTSIT